MSITLTEKAVKEIKRVMEESNMSLDDTVLEVGVLAGGCAGFSYSLNLKKKAETDALNETFLKFADLEVVVNNKALTLIEGTTVDYHDGLNKRGFAFNNPLAKGCGCGTSFQ
jgi:iron-sulfur cluster assembly protein